LIPGERGFGAISNNCPKLVPTSVFLGGTFFECSLSGDHPQEDVKIIVIIPTKGLVKFGYKPDMKYNFLN
jgi:hypothetical protein